MASFTADLKNFSTAGRQSLRRSAIVRVLSSGEITSSRTLAFFSNRELRVLRTSSSTRWLFINCTSWFFSFTRASKDLLASLRREVLISSSSVVFLYVSTRAATCYSCFSFSWRAAAWTFGKKRLGSSQEFVRDVKILAGYLKCGFLALKLALKFIYFDLQLILISPQVLYHAILIIIIV